MIIKKAQDTGLHQLGVVLMFFMIFYLSLASSFLQPMHWVRRDKESVKSRNGNPEHSQKVRFTSNDPADSGSRTSLLLTTDRMTMLLEWHSPGRDDGPVVVCFFIFFFPPSSASSFPAASAPSMGEIGNLRSRETGTRPRT